MPFRADDGFEPLSDIGLGCMGITAFYGPPMPAADVEALIKAAYDAGYRHFDTAEIYKTGNILQAAEGDVWNESAIGPFLCSLPRDKFTVATKFMARAHDSKCNYEAVKSALTASLERLGLEYVDIYYCHRIPTLEKCLEFMASCKRLVEEGLMRHVGLSEISGPWLKKANEVYPVSCIQQEWSLMSRSAEESLLPTCAKLGVGIVAYSPLARNLLASAPTDKPKDWRASQPRYSDENLKKNAELCKEIEALGKAKGATAAQLSLAWLYFRARQLGVNVLPIPGTTKAKHAESNFAATKIELSDEEAALLEAIAARTAGERGDEGYMARSFESQDPGAVWAF